MPGAPEEGPSFPTPRSIGLGLAFGALLCLVIPYNDFYLHNTPLMGNHLPISGTCLLFVLALGLNPLLRRFAPGLVLRPGELITIYVLLCVCGGFAAAGLWRYLPSFMGAAAYHANESNGYAKYLLPYLPDWMLISKDGASPLIKGFFEGASAGVHPPWMAWLRPLSAWSIYLGGLYVSMLCLSVLFSNQWIQRERFVFPLAILPFQLAEEPAQGKQLNSLLRNKLMWGAFMIPFLIWGYNGLNSYYPALPRIKMSWETYGWFQTQPWNRFHLQSINIFFSIIGISFLLTSEVSFSIWAFFVLFRLSFVGLAALGIPDTQYFGDWDSKVGDFQGAGAYIVMGFFTFYVARRHLAEVFRSALPGGSALYSKKSMAHHRASDPASALAESGSSSPHSGFTPWGARLVLFGCLAGPVIMVGWFIAAGVQPLFAVAGAFFFLIVLLVLTRLVCEAGLMYLGNESNPQDIFIGLFTPKVVSPPTAATFAVQRGVLMHDPREFLMPYLSNGLKLGESSRFIPRRIIAAFVGAMLTGFLFGGLGVLGTSYKYGMANMDYHTSQGAPSYFLPPSANFTKAETTPEPGRYRGVHILVGAAGAALLLFLRNQFVWWPLHPYGWLICTTYAAWMIWFSVFLGWLLKVLAMKLGGPRFYRAAVPAFLGLVLGESVIAGIWALISLVLGRPGIAVLPT